ncbi:MAG: homoserine kinase [Holophagales bacterium]|nr:homoserine kinase [Holophagales bacterium]
MSVARAFAPASVSNLACGFDVLGFAVDGPGDEVVAELRDRPGLRIAELTGDGGRLPLDPAKNTAGVAVRHLLEQAGATEQGVTLRVHKRMPLASGLGSSAASAVAAVRAVDALLDLDLPREALLRAALEGERAACGSAHPDNATPSLYGGLVLIRSNDPLDVVELPVPEDLSCALVRPHVEVETRAARQALGEMVALGSAVRQWGNLGALVAALYRGDLDLLSRSLVDHIAEPVRAPLVPGFREIQSAAREAGALGCSLSGSGPSIFALCATPESASTVASTMVAAAESLGLDCDQLVSPVGTQGAHILA